MNALGGEDDLRESTFCAFCAARVPESGEPCCADYAAALELFNEPTSVAPPPAVAAAPVVTAPAAPVEAKSVARPFSGSYVLFGILAGCVIALGVALILQMRSAAEGARELAETRRVSEEMIALMKEARREAAAIAVAPPVPPIAPMAPPIAAAVPPIVPAADAAANPVAPLPPPAVVAAEPSLAPAAPAAQVASAAPAPAIAVPAPIVAAPVAAPAPPEVIAMGSSAVPAPSAPAEPAVAAESAAAPVEAPRVEPVKPAKKAPRVVKAAREKIETRRRTAAAEAREQTPELDRDPASVASAAPVSPPADPPSLSSEPAPPFQEFASLPPAVRSTSLPPRAILTPWTKLVRGMTRKEVRKILGEPRATDRLMTGEFWYYADRSVFGRGWVVFSDGALIEWLSP